METKSVQKGRKAFHHDQDANGDASPSGEQKEEHKWSDRRFRLKAHTEQHGPKYVRKLCKLG